MVLTWGYEFLSMQAQGTCTLNCGYARSRFRSTYFHVRSVTLLFVFGIFYVRFVTVQFFDISMCLLSTGHWLASLKLKGSRFN
jgi:hypothetical protein